MTRLTFRSETGLTLVEILIACTVIAALILLGLSIWNRQERNRLQAQAIQDPGSVFELSITPTKQEVEAESPFTLVATIHNPTRHKLNFAWDADSDFRFPIAENTFAVLNPTDEPFKSAYSESRSEDSSDSTGNDVAIYSATIYTDIQPDTSVDFQLTGKIRLPGTYAGRITLGRTLYLNSIITPLPDLTPFKPDSPLVSNPVKVTVTDNLSQKSKN